MSDKFQHTKTKREYNRQSNDLPYRTDIVKLNNRFDDLARQIIITYKTYSDIEEKIAPLVARNSSNTSFFLTREWIDEQIKNSYNMNPSMYRRLLENIEKFYQKHKSSKRLPSPHIISHRSVHFGEGLFEIKPIDITKYLEATKDHIRNFKVNSVHQINVDGINSFYIENMRYAKYRYMILRPKLGKSGAPMPDKWEILLFTSDLGYNVEHIDTEKNPRYNGNIQ